MRMRAVLPLTKMEIPFRYVWIWFSVKASTLSPNPPPLPCLASVHWVCSATADVAGKHRSPPEVQDTQHRTAQHGRPAGRPFFVRSQVHPQVVITGDVTARV